MTARRRTRPPARGRIARAAVAPDFSAREHLLNAAGQLMSERHTIDVSLSEIAQRSGLNSALVKYYFGNKEGLMLALVQREASRALAELELLLGLDLSPSEKLQRHIAGIINNFFRTPYLNRLLHSLLDERNSRSRSAREVTRFFVKPLLALQRRLLRQGVAAGEFRSIDPVLFYVSVLGACDHLFNARYVLRPTVSSAPVTEALRERYIGHVTDIFMQGISPRLARARPRRAARAEHALMGSVRPAEVAQ
jgi:AcrR family transcriptional regulator